MATSCSVSSHLTRIDATRLSRNFAARAARRCTKYLCLAACSAACLPVCLPARPPACLPLPAACHCPCLPATHHQPRGKRYRRRATARMWFATSAIKSNSAARARKLRGGRRAKARSQTREAGRRADCSLAYNVKFGTSSSTSASSPSSPRASRLSTNCLHFIFIDFIIYLFHYLFIDFIIC